MLPQTPSQTVGPYFSIGLADRSDGPVVVHGRVLDGANEPVSDALVEIWQADRFGRAATDAVGRYRITTSRPRPRPAADGVASAPHLAVAVFARGLLQHLCTRVYFPDESAANAVDPLLASLDPRRRATLVGLAETDGSVRFDIRLQGDDETVFLDFAGY